MKEPVSFLEKLIVAAFSALIFLGSPSFAQAQEDGQKKNPGAMGKNLVRAYRSIMGGKLDAAEVFLQRAQDSGESQAWIQLNLGVVYHLKKLYAQSEAAYLKAIELAEKEKENKVYVSSDLGTLGESVADVAKRNLQMLKEDWNLSKSSSRN